MKDSSTYLDKANEILKTIEVRRDCKFEVIEKEGKYYLRGQMDVASLYDDPNKRVLWWDVSLPRDESLLTVQALIEIVIHELDMFHEYLKWDLLKVNGVLYHPQVGIHID